MATPPKQVRLDLTLFPKEPWAKALVDAFNQFSGETTAAFGTSGATFKELSIKTGASVAASFPIDVKVEKPITSARVAMVLSGVPSGAVTVAAQALSGGRVLRVSNITGLAANTTYAIRLALE